MHTVISVENLSKAYRLGQIGTGTLTYDMKLWWARFLGKPNPLLKIGEPDHGNRQGESVLALKDVSFKVEQGEVLGIIGPNGAGKSTLLKILSRVTAPTSGRIKGKGRVASLLEVGTGFHPDLTGRENTYLNGAILGMSRREIDRKFDEIVDFAGVEKFIDTPVKRYSSGMYVRLAFAVAAHLEPEILLVDEVLAVGDFAFQKKCLGKMEKVSQQGRTVLFVSHSMSAVSALCPKSILLINGHIKMLGESDAVIAEYQADLESTASIPLAQRQDRNGSGKIRLVNLAMTNPSRGNGVPASGEPVHFSLKCVSTTDKPPSNVAVAIRVRDTLGSLLFTCSTRHTGNDFDMTDPTVELECQIESLPLMPGAYPLELWSAIGQERADCIENVGRLVVKEGDFFGSGRLPTVRKDGQILVNHSWAIKDSKEKEQGSIALW